MHEAIINSKKFNIEFSKESPSINNIPIELDMIATGEEKINVIYKSRSVNAELVSIKEDGKTVSVKIDNEVYQVNVKDKLDLLLEKLGMTNLTSSKVTNVKAPMPGLILSILVNEGDEVKKGDSIMILEAMKMENIIKSPGDGVITTIPVSKGDSVEKNTVLVHF